MLADLVLVLHAGIAAFIVAGFLLIPAGAALGWRWVRRRRLRQLHAGAILFVALEALAGVACPLTVLEDALRGSIGGEAGFVARWLSRLLYWEFPVACFTLLYVLLALLAAWLWRRVPPQAP
ncbi:MAG TPA: DUF2784 family protein [Candidatus Desulfobacillus sp.]|nr:DUF2784 family protein [Candidatus Desulfobacillus sp.]